jgi:hemerythrin superfamily protein
VSRHLSAEEQYLYPTVKALLPDGAQLSEREIERDTQILKQLALLETVPRDSAAFTELAEAIDTDLHHHREACAAEIFPQLRELATEVELIRLGNRIEVAQEAAPTRPHPDSPTSPPWNKITDPALGIIDKIRDVVAGRKTYPEDQPTKESLSIRTKLLGASSPGAGQLRFPGPPARAAHALAQPAGARPRRRSGS